MSPATFRYDTHIPSYRFEPRHRHLGVRWVTLNFRLPLSSVLGGPCWTIARCVTSPAVMRSKPILWLLTQRVVWPYGCRTSARVSSCGNGLVLGPGPGVGRWQLRLIRGAANIMSDPRLEYRSLATTERQWLTVMCRLLTGRCWDSRGRECRSVATPHHTLDFLWTSESL